MKRGIMVFMLFWISISPAHAYAFYAQPYPAVLSPAVDILPPGTTTIIIADETFYYCQGTFYQKIVIDHKYTAVPPPIGAVVFSLPPGYEYMLLDGIPYYIYKGVYYKRVLEGFKVMYPPL